MPNRMLTQVPRWMALAVLPLVLAGCISVGPDYEEPDVPVPDAWRNAPEAAEAGNVGNGAGWWTVFGDPALDALVERVHAENYSLASAVATMEAYAAQLNMERAGLFPSVSASGKTGEDRQSELVHGETEYPENPAWYYNAGLSLSWAFYVNYMRIIQGAIIQSFSIEIKRKLEETPEELLSLAIIELRQRFESSVHEIIVPMKLDMELENVKFTIPQKGEKFEILDLSTRNAKQYRFETEKLRSLVDPERHSKRILAELQKDLHLSESPTVIECFDNSNFQGDYAVAGMVQFVNGKPNKAGYRHFNIKTVEGPDDYASMREVIRRRYSRLVEESKELPNLIITDGGKGQMEVVRQVIQDELHIDIPIAGLAKNDSHRTNELLFGFPPRIVQLKPNSSAFHLLAQIQEEVHRFAISFHRKKFEKGFVHSELNEIKGIGKTTAEKLLLELKSVKNIKSADLQKLSEVIGPAKAKIVFAHFH